MPDAAYNINLNRIIPKNPDIYNDLINLQVSSAFHMVPTPSGLPTLLYTSSKGSNSLIHSPENPGLEAEDLVEDMEFINGDITILFGFGLGYLPLAILESMAPHHCLIIVEASLDILSMAFKSRDLSGLINDKRVNIISTGQKKIIFEILEREQLKVIGGKVNKLIYPPGFEIFRESYADMEGAIERCVNSLKNNYLSFQNTGAVFTENILNNLIYIPEAAPIDSLFETARDTPAVIVAAGPSLNKNISELRKIKGKGLIISVDAALKPLIDKGIKPDLVISGDPVQANLLKFEGLSVESLDHTAFVFSPYLYHKIPALFKGAKFFYNEDNLLSRWALDLCGEATVMPYGSSVSHYAFYLARLMGASPIIFTGLDLAFPINMAHAEGCNKTWDMDWSRKDLPFIKDINGREIPTIDSFIDAVTIFEKEIARTKSVCIDSTEGGAYIPGTGVMDLSKSIEQFISNRNDLLHIDFESIWKKRPVLNINVLTEGLHWLEKEATELTGLSESALSIISQILDKLDSGDNGNSIQNNTLQKINEISDQVNSHQKFKSIFKDRLAKTIVEQYFNNFQIEKAETDIEKILIGARQSNSFFTEINKISRSVHETSKALLPEIARRYKNDQ